MSPVAVVFVMYEHGHFQPTRVLTADLVRAGFETHVFTDRRLRDEVEATGASFVDLFAGGTLEEADSESVPLPCRNVTFAGVRAEALAREAERLGPSIVVHDLFAVVGRVVAHLLDLPYVTVCVHHDLDPQQERDERLADPRTAVAPVCLRAVDELRRLGIEDASPFSYLDGPSPHLNVYCEPAHYLAAEGRRRYEPVAFYGLLPSLAEIETRLAPGSPSPFGDGPARMRVYGSFGTVVWRYWTAEAIDVLATISRVLGEMDGVRGLIALGGIDHGPGVVRSLDRPNVSVVGYADQWRALRDSDVFVTHHGVNSTHEAVFSLVPMISYPFFGDQPALAETCSRLGIAVPLASSPLASVTEQDVRAALDGVRADRARIGERLAEARRWELDTIAARGSVLERIAALVGGEPEDAAT